MGTLGLPPPQCTPVCPLPLVCASGHPLPHSPQKEFFQDDVFPDTAVSWEPVLSAEAWLGGANGQPRLLSLQPLGMTPGRIRDWGGRREVGEWVRVGERGRIEMKQDWPCVDGY